MTETLKVESQNERVLLQNNCTARDYCKLENYIILIRLCNPEIPGLWSRQSRDFGIEKQAGIADTNTEITQGVRQVKK